MTDPSYMCLHTDPRQPWPRTTFCPLPSPGKASGSWPLLSLLDSQLHPGSLTQTHPGPWQNPGPHWNLSQRALLEPLRGHGLEVEREQAWGACSMAGVFASRGS